MHVVCAETVLIQTSTKACIGAIDCLCGQIGSAQNKCKCLTSYMRLNVYSPTHLLLSDNLHGICKSIKKQASFLVDNCTTLNHNPSFDIVISGRYVGHMWGTLCIYTGYVTSICAQLVVKYPTNYMGQCTAWLHSVQRYTNLFMWWVNFPRLVHCSDTACSLTLNCIHTFGEDMDIWVLTSYVVAVVYTKHNQIFLIKLDGM